MTIGQDIDRMLEKLKGQREELKLQAHLFKAETRDEWEKVEGQWQHIQSRAREVGRVGSEAGEEIALTVRNLGQEILDGYSRIKKKL